MTMQTDRPFVQGGAPSEQAEKSSINPGATRVQDRILIELQVISMLLHEGFGTTETLAQIRADVAASIT